MFGNVLRRFGDFHKFAICQCRQIVASPMRSPLNESSATCHSLLLQNGTRTTVPAAITEVKLLLIAFGSGFMGVSEWSILGPSFSSGAKQLTIMSGFMIKRLVMACNFLVIETRGPKAYLSFIV